MEITVDRNWRHWWVFLTRGILFILLGIYMFASPAQSYAALAFLFGLISARPAENNIPKRNRFGPAILKVGHGDELFDFLIFEKLWWNCGCVDGFEEYLPGGEDDVGCQGQEIAEKGGALCDSLSCSLPRRFNEIEYRMPGEGEKIEGGQGHCQEFFAMTEVVLKLITVIFHHVEALVLDLPSRSAGVGDFGDVVF